MNAASNEPRLCIVGAGALSTRRIYPYIGAAGARLVGVCDMDADKAQRNVRLFGGTAYDQLDAMLDAVQPDGVIVCVGPEQHATLAAQVLRRGLPVYTEKPPAATAADALVVARLAAEHGVLCTTAFKKRYTAATIRAKQWIDEFAPGDRFTLSVDYASGAYANKDPRSLFLLDFALHLIDLVPYLFGEVTRVFAFAKGPNAYAVSLEFACGAVGTMSLSDGRSYTVPTEELELTMRGGNFMTIHNSACWRITREGQPAEWREPPTFASSGDSGHDTGHLAELEDFVKALVEKRDTRSNIYESYKTMALYEAIQRSADTGQVVEPRYEVVNGG